MNIQVILGLIATVIAFVAYIPYYRDIFSGKTKPHTFTWLIWTLVTGIGFFGQLSDNAGEGAWVMGFSTLACLGIFLLSLKKGEKAIDSTDYFCLFLSFLAIIVWVITKNPFYSIILITIIDIFAFFPTIRKSVFHPYEETLSSYLLSGTKFIVSLFALEQVSFITAFYPSYLIVANIGFVMFLLLRRRVISQEITIKERF